MPRCQVSALAWPLVALLLGAAALWRLDVFVRRFAVGQLLAKRVAHLEAQVPAKTSLDEVVALRDKLTQLTNRLGPVR